MSVFYFPDSFIVNWVSVIRDKNSSHCDHSSTDDRTDTKEDHVEIVGDSLMQDHSDTNCNRESTRQQPSLPSFLVGLFLLYFLPELFSA